MNWEEIETEERPVTFLECAIVARFGGVVPKGELWCWDFASFDIATDCHTSLDSKKFEQRGLRISLREEPMPAVWTIQLCDSTRVGMVFSLVFRAFPSLEKMKVPHPDNLFSRLELTSEFEKRFLTPAFMNIQKYREARPDQKSVHCPIMIQTPFVKPGTPALLCIISYQEVL